MQEYTATTATLADVAAHFLNQLQPRQNGATVVTLSGDLGVGKTTFMQALAQALGVTEIVTSPTFVVMRIYDTNHSQFVRLVHIDAYRFESPEELKPLGLESYLTDPSTLICIEWPERLEASVPTPRHELIFSVVDEVTRMIRYVQV